MAVPTVDATKEALDKLHLCDYSTYTVVVFLFFSIVHLKKKDIQQKHLYL